MFGSVSIGVSKHRAPESTEWRFFKDMIWEYSSNSKLIGTQEEILNNGDNLELKINKYLSSCYELCSPYGLWMV